MRVLESGEMGFPSAALWDAFVACDPRGHLLQTWAWGELKGSFGWRPLRLAIERDGRLVAGAQVLYRRAGPWSVGYMPRGPILLEDDPPVLQALWQAVHRRSRGMRAVLLKVEPEWQEEEAQRWQALAGDGMQVSSERIQPRRTIVVDLEGTPDDLLARMKPKWRYNIRLSQRKGVVVREGGPADVGAFHELMRITGARDAFGVHSLAYYRRAIDLFQPEGRVKLYLAYHEGALLAGLVVYAFNSKAWYMYGASGSAHRDLMPNHQLQWRAMEWARGLGCRHYDLWGITDGDAQAGAERAALAPLAGVQRFKEGFGGQVVSYVGAYDYVYSRPLSWLLRQAWARRGGLRAA